jgi:hypothetical protein
MGGVEIIVKHKNNTQIRFKLRYIVGGGCFQLSVSHLLKAVNASIYFAVVSNSCFYEKQG